jgi:hypothetical protein
VQAMSAAARRLLETLDVIIIQLGVMGETRDQQAAIGLLGSQG